MQDGTTNNSDSNQLEQLVTLYPNPAGDVAILTTGDLHVEQIEMFNTLGQLVRSIPPSGERSVRIETKTFPQGMYTIRVHTAEGVLKKRLLVQH